METGGAAPSDSPPGQEGATPAKEGGNDPIKNLVAILAPELISAVAAVRYNVVLSMKIRMGRKSSITLAQK